MSFRYSIKGLLVSTALVALVVFIWVQFRPPPNVAPDELALSIHFLDGLSGVSESNQLPRIRFLHYGCHLTLLLTNNSDQKLAFWKPECPEGDMAIRLEFKTEKNSRNIGAAHKSQGYTGGMGIPKTFELVPGDSLVHRIDLASYWSLPFELDDGDDATVYVRAVYESLETSSDRNSFAINPKRVWTGKILTDWQQIRLSNASGKPVRSRQQTNILDQPKTAN